MKYLIAIVFALFSLNATAQAPEGLSNDWVPVVTNSDVSQTHYVNLKSIEKTGQIVKVWTAKTGSVDSNKVLREFNCKTNQSRSLSIIIYKKANFTETDVSTHEPGSWSHLVPDSIAYALRDFVCKTK